VGGAECPSGALYSCSRASGSRTYTALFAWAPSATGYDLVVLGCQGSRLTFEKMPYMANMKAYADGGGRIRRHFQSAWVSNGPSPWPTTASWSYGIADLPARSTPTVIHNFPKGMALR
jgi:hypothetical protein